MKHFTLLFSLILLSVLPLRADSVDALRAAEVARAFFRNDRNVALRMAPLQSVERAAVPLTKAAEEQPPFYIFNRAGGGFVIVAAEDACNPILGYSFTNSFGRGADMPEGLSAWLDDIADQVVLSREATSDERARALRQWDAMFVQTKADNPYQPAIKYDTPLWGQGTPFNNLAPEVGGKKAVCGCVPLAMSMLARFYGYPAAGKGTLPSYSYTTDSGENVTIPGMDLGKPYDWSNIRMEYKGEYTAAEADAVAQLVYECGVMVQAKFDASTSAKTHLVAGKAIDHLGFDAGATYYYRAYFSDAVWLDMLKKELQEHPVIYAAHRDGGGHTFLVDGYDEAGNLSVNWGWSGESNGYYALSAFVPNPNRQYLFQHAAIIGFKPDQGGMAKEYLYLLSGTSSSGTVFKGLEPDGTIVPRKSFNMKVGGVCNGGNDPFAGYFILALTDADGNIKDFVSGSQYYDLTSARSWRGYTGIPCILNTYPLEGDRIRAFYRSENWGENQWTPFLYDTTDETLVTEIPVFDNQTLAEATTFSYAKTLQIVSIDTKDHVNWTFKSSTGADASDCVTYAGVQMSIAASKLKGAYTLTLQRGNDKLSLTLTF